LRLIAICIRLAPLIRFAISGAEFFTAAGSRSPKLLVAFLIRDVELPDADFSENRFSKKVQRLDARRYQSSALQSTPVGAL
jgi:hypothetical protein